jgi:hypothetical protein
MVGRNARLPICSSHVGFKAGARWDHTVIDHRRLEEQVIDPDGIGHDNIRTPVRQSVIGVVGYDQLPPAGAADLNALTIDVPHDRLEPGHDPARTFKREIAGSAGFGFFPKTAFVTRESDLEDEQRQRD